MPDTFQDCHTISLFDLSGRLCLQGVHCGNECRLDVKEFKPGFYFLQLINQKGVSGHKFLIK
ncbi:MAG: T9SS type A sorting domain-containing protein [Bacteroidales bacterium]|nr:T9SS type A sorting domain-containing protein [Bacteroidales bacterium]